MKQAILDAYPWPTWEAKVAKMSDKQIAAVYMRLLNQNKL